MQNQRNRNKQNASYITKDMSSSESELLEKARQMDVDALTHIYDQLSPGIYRYAYRLLGDEMLAEECVSETFSRFLTKLQERKGPKNFLKAYLYRVAHNWITDFYRRPLPEEPNLPEKITAPNKSPEEATLESIENQKIREALLTLPSIQQQVIILKFLENWSNQEIAKSIKKSEGAVKALQNRAFKKLRALLEETGEI